MSPDDLFIHTLEDLNGSLASADEYETIRASGLMRQLFLDGANSLVTRVNRDRRQKLTYPFAPVAEPPLDSAATWCAADTLYPVPAPPSIVPRSVPWHQFEKLVVAHCGGHAHTVHNVIDYAAHVEGGVHLGVARSDRDRALAALAAKLPGIAVSQIVSLLRAIGRVILDGLQALSELVIGVARFEGGPGVSVFANLTLGRMPGGEENYIVDIGIDAGKDRVTVFLDAHGDLCVRVFSASGRMHTIRAGVEGGAYRYGRPMPIACEIGCAPDGVLLNLDGDGFGVTRLFQGPDVPTFARPVPLVIGSDVTGRCRGQLHMAEMFVTLNVPSHDDRMQSRMYLRRKLAEAEQVGKMCALEFSPGACMHTVGHPNFPGGTSPPGSLIAPSDDRRPVLRELAFPFLGVS